MPNTYDRGDLIRLTGTFTDASGSAVDPSAVIFQVLDPDNAEISYGYNLSSQGNWDASANSPALADGTGTAGNYYTANVAGTQTFGGESLAFAVGDLIFYNGYIWRRIRNLSATTPTKSATGIYFVDVNITVGGNWYYVVEGAGSNKASGQNRFMIRSRPQPLG